MSVTRWTSIHKTVLTVRGLALLAPFVLVALSSQPSARHRHIAARAEQHARACGTQTALNRRELLATSLLGAPLLASVPFAASADTQAMYDTPQAGFDSAAEKRQVFIKKQKVFKKAWRSLLSDLEFASGDAEALAAIKGLVQLIVQNGLEIPEGVRKQDLDQVYLVAKPRLQKETRLEFKKLDALVLQIVTVKNSDVENPL